MMLQITHALLMEECVEAALIPLSMVFYCDMFYFRHFFFLPDSYHSFDKAHRDESNQVDLIGGTHCRANRHVKHFLEDSYESCRDFRVSEVLLAMMQHTAFDRAHRAASNNQSFRDGIC
jgi:hypothetical protein